MNQQWIARQARSASVRAMEPLRGAKGWPLTDREVEGLRLLGVQLRRARLGNGWSQRRLERASGIDQTTISRLENGRLASLRLTKIARLMQALQGQWEIVPELVEQTDSRPDRG